MGKLANPYRTGTVYHNIAQEKPLLYKYQWILEFIGGGGFFIDYNFNQFTLFDKDQSNPDTCFAYWLADSTPSIPNFDIQTAKIPYYSMQFNVPACRKYGHELNNVKILLDQDFTMYKKLETWLKMISRLNIDGGGIKVIPTVKLRLMLLDSQHAYFTDSFVFEGAWISKLGGANLAYKQGGGGKMTADVVFKYQYCYRDPQLDLANDPLSVAKILAAAGSV